MESLFGARRSVDNRLPSFRLVVQRPTGSFDGTAVLFVGKHASFDGGRARAFAAAFQFALLNGFFFGLFSARTEGFGEPFAGERAIL